MSYQQPYYDPNSSPTYSPPSESYNLNFNNSSYSIDKKKTILYLIFFGVMVTFLVFVMGVAGHILSTGPTWRQRAASGITGSSFCFSQDTLGTYSTLLMIPCFVHFPVLILASCCFANSINLPCGMILAGMLLTGVCFGESIIFADLANQHIISTVECPFSNIHGDMVRVDKLFLTPMAIVILGLSVPYILYGFSNVKRAWQDINGVTFV